MRKNYFAFFFTTLFLLLTKINAQQPQDVGEWSDPIPFNLIPVAVANLPDGRLLTWSSRFRESRFDGADGFTYTEIFDPNIGANGQALGLRITDNNHNMFCPGINNLADGRIMVTGGGSAPRTTIYDPQTETWVPAQNMNVARAYQGNVTLANGEVFTIGGQWDGGSNGKIGEIWTPEDGWKRLPGIPMEVLFNDNDLLGRHNRPADHAWVWAAPNGQVFHAGPSEDMHWLDINGNGSVTFVGKRSDDVYSISGTTVMYDIGKILKVGGSIGYGNGTPASEKSYVIDINDANNVTVTSTANASALPRTHHNSVVLPNGEVIIIGGLGTARTFSDSGSRFEAEIWNPQTNRWRTVAGMQVPRNYHSVAVLMMDGRVFAGGGGLCGGCSVNHEDAEIYSPPYLFDSNGNLAERPEISAPGAAQYNQILQVQSDDTIEAFSFIRMSSATHSVNNEQRRVPVTFSRNGSNYSLNIPGPNVMPPGYYMLFGIDANGVPSVAESVNVLPGIISVDGVVVTPENIELSEGRSTILNVVVSPASATDKTVNWNSADTNVATVDENGNVTAVAIGTTLITVTTNDGNFSAQTTVTVVEGDGLCIASGTILMEQYNDIDGFSLNQLFNDSDYPNNPDDSQELNSFEIPANVRDYYGVRVRGYLCAPETGTYYFWISGDDESRLNLSTDNNPANITTIANVPDYTTQRQWNKYPEQKSVAVELVQGLSYYIEGFMKENRGGDHLAVGWRKPSDGNGSTPVEVIPGSVLSPAQPCYSSTGPPEVTVTVTDVTCDVDTGAFTFSFPDNTGRTGIEFSIDGGVSFPYNVADNIGSTTVPNMELGTYNLWVRWGNDECQVNLGSYTVVEDCTIIPVSGVVVTPNAITLTEGEIGNLTASVEPSNATDTSVVWSSSDDSVATVDQSGQVNAVSEGTAIITVSTNDGGFEGIATITVERELIPVVGVELDKTSLELVEGETDNLTALVNPTDADDRSVVWSSSDESVATVDENGQVTAISEGVATITVTTNDGGFEAQSEVTVTALQIPRPTQSSPIIVDSEARRVWVVNPDNNSVSLIDTDTFGLLGEFPVATDPVGIAKDVEGNIWVTCRDAGVVQVLSPQGNILNSLNLGRGSQPYAVVNDPAGAYLYVTLFASNKLIKIDATSRNVVDELQTFARPRAMAITTDGSQLFVTQFITENNEGKIARIDLDTFEFDSNVSIEEDSFSPNSSSAAKGIANYLGGIAIQPDSDKAWFTAKKDNVLTGAFRSGQDLNFATTIRAMVSNFSMATGQENSFERIDIDNHNLPTGITISPLGNYVFVTMLTNNRIIVLNANNGLEVLRRDVGFAPSGIIVDPENNRVFVKNFLSRSVHVFDANALITQGNPTLPFLSEINTVSNESLNNQVLQGKQIFYNARDSRMTQQENSDAGYISCASCHIDGTQDGQTWDFTQRGEGLRNTISLRGRAGGAHGNVHWSGNFDEIHDFEGDMRFAFGGTGFMSNQDFFSENRENPLGGPKQGRSAELDALVAYIESLNTFDESPNKNENGTMTSAALQGKALFDNLQCANCHSGQAFTNSSTGLLHDIGTLGQGSGTRLGRALQGLDVPTLRDVWATAPYLHDGSAPTVGEAIGRHALATNLSQNDLELLEAYVLQLDGSEAPAAQGLSFELQVPSTALLEDTVLFAVSTNIPNIQEVIYYADDIEIGRSSIAPYNFNFSPETANNFCIYAKAVHQGMATISPNQTLTITGGGDEPGGTRTVSMEGEDFVAVQDGRVGNYIPGFQGTGFLDMGANSSFGEWQFESNVSGTGTLTIVYSNGHFADRLARVAINGNDNGEIELVASPNCFSWQSFQMENVNLQEGLNSIRITMTSIFGGVDIDYFEVELPAQPVTGVTVDPTETEIFEDETLQLTATVSPADADDTSVSWESSDDTIATVDENGLVTAVAPGNVTITVSTNEDGFEATSNITIIRRPIPVTGIVVDPITAEIFEDETVQLRATVSPANADDTSVTWESSDDSVATVDENGLVTAVIPGNVTMTVSTNEGGFEATSNITINRRPIPVTGIVVDPITAEIFEDETVQLTAAVSPADADDTSVSWESSDDTIATVDENGLVTAVAPGNVTITVTTNEGGFEATSNITINRRPIPVTGIVVHPIAAEIFEDETVQLTATVSPADADDTSVSWESSDNGVATVDENGLVTAVALGNVTITVTTNEGGFEATSNITINRRPIPVTGILIDPITAEIFEDETVQLTATVSPADADDPSVTWESSDESIATVDENGLVTAVAPGNVTITVTTNEGGFEATSNITINRRPIVIEGLDVNPTEATIFEDETIQLTAAINPANADDTSVSWESSDNSVATVDENGLVTAVAPGNVIITLRTNAADFEALSNITVIRRPIPVTGVLVNPITAEIFEDETVQLTATVSPADADNTSVTWESSDETIATVDANGLVTAVAPGNVTITVSTNEGGFEATSNITINRRPILIEGLDVNPTEATIFEDETIQLTAAINPTNADDTSVSWESSDNGVATVDENGLVTAVAPGNVIITLRTNAADFEALSNITVIRRPVPVTGVLVNPITAEIFEDETVQLTATVSPADADDPSVTWESNDESIATVDENGLVTAVAPGNVTIAVTTNEGSFEATSNITINRRAIPVTGITVDPITAEIFEDETVQLTAAINPANADDTSVSWESSDNGVATVDENGLVTAVAPGNVTITVTTNEGGFEATSNITINRRAIPVTGIEVNPTEAEILEGGTQQLTATVSPADADNTSVTWESSDNGVATVDENGLVTAVAPGNVTITVSTNEGGFEATSNITINRRAIPVTGIEVNPTEAEILEGGTLQLTATVSPADADDTSVTWKSSDESIATVDANGLVTAVAPGNVTITVTTNDGNYQATSNITVTNGTVSVTGVTVNPTEVELFEDETVQLTATVMPANADDTSVTWSSNSADVALVDQNGKVMAIAPGTTVITVRTNDGGFEALVNVTVKEHITPPMTGLTVNPVQAEILEEETVQLTAAVLPMEAEFPELIWSSSDESIATVDSKGLVTGIMEGTAIITVATADNAFSATTTIIVNTNVVSELPEDISEVVLFPNPAENWVSLIMPTASNPLETAPLKITIFDSSGRKIREMRLEDLDYEEGNYGFLVDDLRSGVYSLEIMHKNGEVSQTRLIVE